MYKKDSNNKINEFENLGNNTYEFCFNISEYIRDNSFQIDQQPTTGYTADCILVTDISSYDNIYNTLMRDKYSYNEELTLINDYLLDSNNETYNNDYKSYQDYRLLMKDKSNKFINR